LTNGNLSGIAVPHRDRIRALRKLCSIFRRRGHHPGAIVAGGFPKMSYTARDRPFTSSTMRQTMPPSMARLAQWPGKRVADAITCGAPNQTTGRTTVRLLGSMTFVMAALASGGCQRGDPPALLPFRAEVLTRAFEIPELDSGFGPNYRMRVEHLGSLSLSTGKICAVEPFAVHDLVPFTVTVPPGRYVTDLAIADSGNDPRVAFARVKFSSERPVHWKLAVWPHTKVDDLEAGQFVGYPVDGGLGSFMDVATAEELEKLGENEGFYKALSDDFMSDGTVKNYAMLPTERANVAVFATGIGDGVYASYFGFGRSGRPVVLVTDFGMVRWEPVPEHTAQ
jgi:hypothetical protein